MDVAGGGWLVVKVVIWVLWDGSDVPDVRFAMRVLIGNARRRHLA